MTSNLSLDAPKSSHSKTESLMPPLSIPKPILFGSFTVTNQVFHLTPLSFALVNIRPILKGHVLVCPIRHVPRLCELTSTETSDLFLTVNKVTKMLERVLGATAFNVAVQDGKDAGQSVPHVHAHIIPRHKNDMKEPDDVYQEMDGECGDLQGAYKELDDRLKGRGRQEFPKVDDMVRKNRTEEEMVQEATWFAKEMEKDESQV